MSRRVLDELERVVKIGCILSFSVMTIMGVLQVIFRYLIGQSLSFSEELARYMFVWSVFLGSGVCLRRNSHAAIDLFVGWMPRGPRRVSLALAGSVCVAFFAFLLVKGVEITIRTWHQSSASLAVPMSMAYAAVPAGGLIMLVYSLESLCDLLRRPNQAKD